METPIRNTKLSLNEELLSKPKQFSFDMAAYILEFGFQTSFGKETNLSNAPFKTNNINSFHLRGTEIEKISLKDKVPTIYTERLSISGLNAPLPTPYAELIFRRLQEKDEAIGSFVNTFNTRILGISYQISKKRYLNLQNHDKTCLLLKTVATFSGESPETIDKRISRLAYLFWTKEKSAAGLEAIISSFLQFKTNVVEIRTIWTDRQKIQPLGKTNLGYNAELGTRYPSFGIEVHLTHSDYNKIFQLITDEDHLNNLKQLMKKYLGNFIDCMLHLIPQNVPPLEMGKTYLGKTSWIPGKVFDSAKIIC